MADTVQIGTFDSNGRFTSLLDLNDGVNFALVRDTLNISPLQGEQTIMAKSGRRFGGARPTGAMHDNGVFEAEWYINSPTHSDDATWANFDKLVAILQDAAGGPYYIKFKTQGATHVVYHELKLPIPYDPLYRWIEMQGTHTLHIKASFPIAPLAVGESLDVLDSFAIDTLSDYTALAGAGSVTWSSPGVLAVSSTSNKFFQHTARGYQVPDSQNTLIFRTGASGAGTVRVAATLLDTNNYLFVEQTGTTLRLGKRDGGVESTLGSTAALTLSPNTTYVLRIRKEGNSLIGHIFTADPSPFIAPTQTVSATLAGGDATKFGVGVLGGDAWYLTPAGTDWQINAFRAEPYTYGYNTNGTNYRTPITYLLRSIPGTAPAQVDFIASSSDGTVVPAFALLGWTKNPGVGSAPAPFGVIEGESASSLGGMTVTAVAGAHGGSVISAPTGTSAGGVGPAFLVDPSLLVADDFTEGEIAVEVWVRMLYGAAGSNPILTLNAQPEGVSAGFKPIRYSLEYGATGKTLVVPTTSAWRLVRAGTLMLPVRPGGSRWTININITWGAGASGNIQLDYLLVNPARQRALSPTGKIAPPSIGSGVAAYPSFFVFGSETRRIRHDLAGFTTRITTGPGKLAPAVGLGGQLLEFPPGDVLTLVKFSSLGPDDPTSNNNTETDSSNTPVRFSIRPRYHLNRSS